MVNNRKSNDTITAADKRIDAIRQKIGADLQRIDTEIQQQKTSLLLTKRKWRETPSSYATDKKYTERIESISADIEKLKRERAALIDAEELKDIASKTLAAWDRDELSRLIKIKEHLDVIREIVSEDMREREVVNGMFARMHGTLRFPLDDIDICYKNFAGSISVGCMDEVSRFRHVLARDWLTDDINKLKKRV